MKNGLLFNGDTLALLNGQAGPAPLVVH